MKKRIFMFLALFLILIVSISFAGKPLKPRSKLQKCFIWYLDYQCNYIYDGEWLLTYPYSDPDGDDILNQYECLRSLNPQSQDTDKDGIPEGPPDSYGEPPDKSPGQEDDPQDVVRRDQRTPGFWTENGCTYKKYTKTQIEALFRCVSYGSEVFSEADVREMCKVLENQKNQFERHLTALWLNICSNRLSQNCGTNTAISDSATVFEIIEHCEELYLTGGNTTEIQQCKDVFDELNNGIGFDNITYGVQCIACPDNMDAVTGYTTKSIFFDAFLKWIRSIF